MVSEDLRWRLSGGGLVVIGIAVSILSYLQLGAPLASVLFVLVAVAGILMLLRRVQPYAVTLTAVGILALLSGVLGYLQEGVVALTAVYLILGIVGTIQGVQAYRST